MNRGTGIAAVLVAMALLAVPMLSEDASAAGAQPFLPQLDANSRLIYDALGDKTGTMENTVSVDVALNTRGSMMLFDDEASAGEYGRRAAFDAMAAKYYGDPLMVHLWDLPLGKTDVSVQTAEVSVSQSGDVGRYYTASSVSFKLSVPERMMDDTDTVENELSEKMESVRKAFMRERFDGSVPDMAEDIADFLGGVEVIDDEEGCVSNVYDALVLKRSSSAGVAAAFTCIAAFNGMDAITVKGDLYSDGEPRTGYWNMVLCGGAWYGMDVPGKNLGCSGCVMAGFSTPFSDDDSGPSFGDTHVADLDLADPNSLTAPQLNRSAYPYPVVVPFLDRYGAHLMLGAVSLIIIATMVYAIKKGNI